MTHREPPGAEGTPRRQAILDLELQIYASRHCGIYRWENRQFFDGRLTEGGNAGSKLMDNHTNK